MSTVVESFVLSEHVRTPTDEEVAFYRENGWVYLEDLISDDLAGELLQHVKQVVGLDYDELAEGSTDERGKFTLTSTAFNLATMPRLEDDFLRQYQESREVGEIAARLTGKRPIRLVTDSVIYKLPEWTGSGDVTNWHQDLPNMPLDRTGPVQLWLALCEVTPEMGAMQHLSGSHKEGRLTNLGQRTLPELFEAHPELRKYPLSEPHHFNPGDALAHDALCLHGAEPNHTNRIRWAYTSYRMPADVCYTASPPSPWLDGLGLEKGKPMDHPLLPIVTE